MFMMTLEMLLVSRHLTFRRSHRGFLDRKAVRRREDHHLRYGRNQRGHLPDRELHSAGVQREDGRGISREDPDDQHHHHRRGRWLHRRDRRRRSAEGGTEERRSDSGTGLLYAGRRESLRHGRQHRPRKAEPEADPGRPHGGGSGAGWRKRRSGRRSAKSPAWTRREPRTASSPS